MMLGRWKYRRQVASVLVGLFLVAALLIVTQVWRQHRSERMAELIQAQPLEWHTLQSPAGKWAALDVPGNFYDTQAYGINNSGQIVGAFNDTRNRAHGYVFADDFFHVLDVPSSIVRSGTHISDCAAQGINNAGDIVGCYSVTGDPKGYGLLHGRTHGFLFSHGKYVTIDAPNDHYGTSLSGINDKGQIIGQYYDGKQNQGFLLQQGRVTLLSIPGGTDVMPKNIYYDGKITGSFEKTAPKGHNAWQTFDFLLDTHGYHVRPSRHVAEAASAQGRLKSRNAPRAVLEKDFWSANNQGEAVGTYRDGTKLDSRHDWIDFHPSHGFVFIPRNKS